MALASLIARLRKDAKVHNHRRLLLVSGSREWCSTQMANLPLQPQLVWLGDRAPQAFECLSLAQAHRLLGQSVQTLVIDAWSCFNPNGFGQAVGTLSGGGVLILLCPPLAQWPQYDDPEYQSLVAYPYTPADAGRRFLSRLVRLLEDDPYTLLYSEPSSELSSEQEGVVGVELELPEQVGAVEIPNSSYSDGVTEPAPPHKTQDQQQAVELILQQFRRGRRPVVLTADRGRGKSVALGIAAAQLSGLDYKQIIITAPEYAAAAEAFNMAHQLLPDYQWDEGKLIRGEHSIRFMEPDLALQVPGEGQVLLVDEAAALPVPILSQLLARFPRVAFASTIHGYEGTGQGFALRFRKILDERTPNWKGLHLNQPIRWSPDDPLEQLSFNLLMLNAEAADFEAVAEAARQAKDEDIAIELLDRDQLIEDYATLGQLFGLLVLAHYRTSPGDLRILLDSPNLYVWVLRLNGLVAGAALVAEEGPLQPELVEAIWSGQRRPKGHLLPQTLVAQEGARMAAPLQAGRIMRIAVHPALQRSGLGSRLLDQVQESAVALGWDYLGSSFAASADLLQFWQHNHFLPVRLGSARDRVSGCHAALVIQACSKPGLSLQQTLQQRFQQQLHYRLRDDLSDLNVELLCVLLQQPEQLPALDQHDRSDLQAFTAHNRSYESCAFSIHKLLLKVLASCSDEQLRNWLTSPDFVLLLERNLLLRSWEQLEQQGQGRKQMMRRLRETVQELLLALEIFGE